MRTWKSKMRRLRAQLLPRLIPALVLPLMLALAFAPAAWADTDRSSGGSNGDNIVTFGDDVHVRAGDSVGSVVVFGANVKVDGEVTNGVYAFGGDLVVGPNGSIGQGVTDQDLTVAVFGGDATAIPGADVIGRELEVKDLDWLTAGDGLLQAPFDVGGLGWGLGLAGAVILGLLAAWLLPKQILAVRAELQARPLPAFGWGLLAALVIVPLVSLVLLVTIVGILALIPWLLIVVPALCLMGYLAAGAFVGERLLQAVNVARQELWLAVLVGVLALEIVSLIPILGPLAFGLVNIAGLGATLLALRGWRRDRKEVRRQATRPATPPPVAA